VGNLLGNATFTQLTISERLTWFFFTLCPEQSRSCPFLHTWEARNYTRNYTLYMMYRVYQELFCGRFSNYQLSESRFWDWSEEQGVFVIDNCDKSFYILNAIIKFKRSSFIFGSIYLSTESTPNSSVKYFSLGLGHAVRKLKWAMSGIHVYVHVRVDI